MEAVAEMREASIARCHVVVAAPARAATHAPAIGFLLLWTLLNLLYLAFACPHDLAPDEAHYWHWSRHLDWSYYSKGPLVAWLIRASCELFGDTMFAVRLPSALASTALLGGLYLLVCDVLKDRRLALGTMLSTATLPGISAGAVITTIDPPYLACWCWSLVGLNRAIGGGSWKWCCFAGVCTAFGVLAKYPMLLLSGIVAFRSAKGTAVARPFAERKATIGGIVVYLLLTLFGCVPIIVWNANHEWLSFQHVFAQAGVNPDTEATWLTPLAFAGGQAGILIGFWFVAFAAGAWRFRSASDTGLSLIWWSSVPVWGVYLLASARTPVQVNWAAASYIGGTVLAAAWIRDHWRFRIVRIGLKAAVLLGLAASLGLRFPQIVRPILAAILPKPTDGNPTPIRKVDVTARLAGWRTLAAEIDRQRERHPNALLAGVTWTIPGELAFHCEGRPEAYSFGPALADRRSQYDLWRPNPMSDPETFRDRTFIYVGDRIPEFETIFERVAEPIRVTHSERGVPMATWTVWVCHGFRGFPPRATPIGY